MLAFLALTFVACDTPAEDVSSTDEGLASLQRQATLPIDVAYPDAAFVELRAVRPEGSLPRNLATGSVQPGAGSLKIPARAPQRDRDPAKPGAPVYYRMALRAADELGAPAQYIGMSDSMLVFVQTAGSVDGATVGWNLLTEPGTEDEAFAPLTDGLVIEPNLLGAPDVAFAGMITGPNPMTHIAVVSVIPGSGDMVQVFDFPTTGAQYSVAMDTPPPGDATYTGGGVTGAVMALNTYDDANGDLHISEGEIITNAACFEGKNVSVTWHADVFTFAGAEFMARQKFRTGFNVLTFSPEGATAEVPADEWGAIDFFPTCGGGEVPPS